MLVLALDTTSEMGGVAIYRDSVCLASVANQGPANVYSITLFEMAARALEQANIRPSEPSPSTDKNGAGLAGLSEVDLFAVANGPGSFTGIRVGAAAVQAWGRAFGRPVRGISVLEALAEAARPDSEWAIPILDARRGEFYLGCFRRPAQNRSAAFEPAGEGWVLRPSDLEAFLRERLPAGASATCVVREHERAALALRDLLPNSYRWQTFAGTLLEALARLGWEAHQKGVAQEPADLHACYIRRPDAESNWRE